MSKMLCTCGTFLCMQQVCCVLKSVIIINKHIIMGWSEFPRFLDTRFRLPYLLGFRNTSVRRQSDRESIVRMRENRCHSLGATTVTMVINKQSPHTYTCSWLVVVLSGHGLCSQRVLAQKTAGLVGGTCGRGLE